MQDSKGENHKGRILKNSLFALKCLERLLRFDGTSCCYIRTGEMFFFLKPPNLMRLHLLVRRFNLSVNLKIQQIQTFCDEN